MEQKIKNWNERLTHFSLEERLNFVDKQVEGRKVFSTSFGIEDQMLTHLIHQLNIDIQIFTLDTGRLFDQTYEVFAATQRKYRNLSIQVFFPHEKDVQEYTVRYGINGFYDAVDSRKQCCHIRKVIPLSRALKGAKLWMTGLRKEQSDGRKEMPLLEWDEQHQLIKFNPLIDLTLKEVEDFIKAHKVPMNTLYKQGFLSIGCAPCTRAVEVGEDFRSGRWWWEQDQKECGLHTRK